MARGEALGEGGRVKEVGEIGEGEKVGEGDGEGERGWLPARTFRRAVYFKVILGKVPLAREWLLPSF